MQKPFGVHVPEVGGAGQSVAVVHAFVHTICIMTFSHSLYVGSVQSVFVVQGEPKVDAALEPELDPLAVPLLDPEAPPLLEPLEPLDAVPELLPLDPLEPPDDELLELPELLDDPPFAAPLLLPLLDPEEPLPELEPGAVPGDVCPAGP